MVNLLERATLPFTIPLTERDFHRLARVLARELKCDVNYSITTSVLLNGNRTLHLGSIKEKSLSTISGMISRVEPTYLITLPFETYRDETQEYDLNHTNGLRFILPTGYDLDEVNKADLVFLDQARGIINSFRPVRK